MDSLTFTLKYTIYIVKAMCFIGHGAFGSITKRYGITILLFPV